MICPYCEAEAPEGLCCAACLALPVAPGLVDAGVVVLAVASGVQLTGPLRRWLIGGECTDESMVVLADGPSSAMLMAEDLWPDADPWWASDDEDAITRALEAADG